MRRLRHTLAVYRLALLTLALQLGLSFGHIHHDLALHPHASWPVVICHVTPVHTCNVPQHDEQRDACGICFAAATIKTAVASALPAVVIERVPAGRVVPLATDPARRLQAVFMFQARGPPRAI